MILIRYSLFITLFCLLAGAQSAHAQCTTDAGTISGGGFYCAGESFSINNMGNDILDANDILIFVAYTGATPNASTVFASTTDVNFPYQSSFLANSPFKVAAVAGNDAGGGAVDWDDPCLSVSNVLIITYLPPPTITTVGGTLTCITSFATASVSANQQNCSYLWSNNSTASTITVQQPGQYCVTVTNQAGCTAEGCMTVTQDIASPVANAGSDQLLNCFTTQVTLDGTNSSSGPNFTYQWWGPGVFPAQEFAQNPIVTMPGAYTLLVTNTANGCTATDQVVVLIDSASPTVNAPDTGIPCGGGTATLNASSGPGQVVYTWIGPNNFSSNTQNPIVSQPGTYTVIVTNTVNGCTSTDQVTVFPGPAIPQQDFAVTNATCPGVNSGAINLTMSVGQAPFTLGWSGPNGFTSTTEDIGNLAPGTYSITATDNTGCTYYANVVVGQTTAMTVSSSVIATNCAGNSGAIVLNIIGGMPPYTYTYQWNGTPSIPGASPTNVITLNNLPAGVYVFTITEAGGCSVLSQPIIIIQPPAFTVTAAPLNCGENSAQVTIVGGTPPYSYLWSTGATTQVVTDLLPGIYSVTIIDANGCISVTSITIGPINNPYCGLIIGQVLLDSLDNCIADPGEQGLKNWIVRADGSSGNEFYGVTDSDGLYRISVEDGNYTLTLVPPGSLWAPCAFTLPLGAVGVGDTATADNFLVQKITSCPALSISIGTNLLRRCFSNNYYYVDYCNDGTATAEDAYVIVTLDPFLSPLWSSLPYTTSGNNVLQFNVGNLDVGECGTFSLQVQVSCNAALGQTHCTEAHIYPDSTCLPNDPSWTGASLKVNSLCDADSVRFIVKNIGQGDMSGTVDYVIIEDAVMLMMAPLQPLGSGDSVTLAFPANGSTWRLEVDQEAFHPGNSQPVLSVEGCSANSSFSTGFVAQFAVNDADPWVDIDCTANIGSYDPNDKQGFPVGYGATHYIRPGTELEYLIRFQNTGTDTAFTVRVVDTLSAWLDPATVRPGASSHGYQFNLTGPGIVEFLFENILLPDSNINEQASSGFVKFSILPRADAPLETVIENEAAIYFDFNDPVITNTTDHRLGENFIVRAWQPFVPGAAVTVSPNPFSDEAILEVKGLDSSAPLRLQVFDLQGVVVGDMETASLVFHLKKGAWPAGVYLFRILQEGKLVGSGKLAVH